jgi:HEPN domain-containing protein
MNTSLKHLSPGQREKIGRAVRIIVRAVQPEKIILFGIYGDNGGSLPPLGAYDLLVITRPEDPRSDYELQDVIENRCREEVAVTALVHDVGYLNRRLLEGQCFFAMAVLEGTLVYDAGRTPLAEASLPDWERVCWMAQRDFRRWNEQAGAFFKSAQFNIKEKQWRIAVFLLHQAAEQCYQAILLAFMGYKPTTHNLDKLRRYTNRLSPELALIFPRDTAEDDDLFRLLSSGYVDARYKEDFRITGVAAAELMNRVERLLQVAEKICLNYIVSLEKKAARKGQ